MEFFSSFDINYILDNSLVLYLCFVDRCLSFYYFLFDHYVVCPSSISRFRLPLWYLQILLNFFPGSQTGGGQQNSQSKQTTQTPTRVQSTTLPNLTIERDHDSRVTMTTGSPSISDLTTQRDHLFQTTPSTLKQTTTGSNNKYTIPVIILTDPGIDKIVDPSSTTTENLTIIRDYPVSGPTTTDNQPPQPARNRRSILIPILSLNSEAQYNNPGNGPKPIGLTDETDQDLVIVRDTDNSGTHSHVVNDKPTTTQSKRRMVVVAACDHDKTRICFNFQ